MKKQSIICKGSLAFLGLISLISCVKPPPSFDPRDGNNVYTGCRIKEIVSVAGEPPAVVQKREYSYNNNNDPVKVTVGPSQGMGLPDLSFAYDNKKRLVTFSGVFHVHTEFDFQFVHRYGYYQNRVVTDTVYELGFFNAAGEPVNYLNKFLKYLKYDALNRIIQDSMILLHPVFVSPAVVANIRYDANGNRIAKDAAGVTPVVYDDKLNLYRTNRVWMLIYRDYSLNNPVGATSYNSVGLPLTYPANDPTVTGVGVQAYATTLTYECR